MEHNTNTTEIQQRHEKKLMNLWNSQRSPAPDCLLNISDRKLIIEEENALRLSLKHHILPRNIDEIQITTKVEKLWQFNKRTIVSGIDPGTERTVKDSIKHTTHSFLHSARSICGSRTNRNFHKTLIKLKKDQSIKVCAFDKGNGIVIMNSKDYFDKLDKIIYDTSKFQEIIVNTNLSHLVIRNENNIKKFLQENVKDFISQENFDFIKTHW